MIQSFFDRAFEYTVGNEGGYTNDPNDPGGPTNWGITQADYSVYLGRHASAQDVKNMPLSDAKKIYQNRYWLALSCDRMIQAEIAIAIFDVGVVRGIGVPPKYAQIACNQCGFSLEVDGHIGDKTIGALNQVDEAAFLNAYEKLVEAGFRSVASSHPKLKNFLKGWLNRSRRLLSLIPKKIKGAA